MDWTNILIIIIMSAIILLTPIYYFYFKKTTNLMSKGKDSLKKELIKLDNISENICIFNHVVDNPKIGNIPIPGIIISRDNVYLLFVKYHEFSKENISTIQKIQNYSSKKLDIKTQVIILDKSYISFNIQNNNIPWSIIKGYNYKKINNLIDLTSGENEFSQNKKRDLAKKIGKL